MRILLSEGSGLTSRQVATCLGELGHEVEVLSSTPLCLARFTRHTARVHRVPPFGAHPLAWLDAAIAVARRRRVEVLLPTQEQIAVLAASAARVPVATVVPPFAALLRVQDKLSASRTLAALGLPQPRTIIATREDDLGRFDAFPAFVKRPVSTASSGVRRVVDPAGLLRAGRELGLPARGVVVQAQADGPLVMVQGVADRGRLVAWHATRRVREGAGGGAAVKESLPHPQIREHLAALVAGLGWHGAIALDAIVTDAGPTYVDVNPRLVEPRNAWLAGVDLVAPMLALAAGGHPVEAAPPRAGIRSHQLLLAVLEAAARASAPRRAVARELLEAARGRGSYEGSVEELTPARGDPLAVIPVAVAAAATLLWPPAWRRFVSASVGAYALTTDGWEELLARATAAVARDHAVRG